MYSFKDFTMGYGTISRNNDTFTAFRYGIVAVMPSAHLVYIAGDQTHDFRFGNTFRIGASHQNNGIYHILNSSFETSTNRTRISVVESIVSDKTDGVLDLQGYSIPWLTGDIVVLNSTKFLPTPLTHSTAYYVIRKSNTHFKLAYSNQDALDGVSIKFTAPGDGFLTVAEVETSFRVLGGTGNSPELWYHLALDPTDIRTLTLPHTLIGMQSFINIMDGYSKFQHDTGLTQGLADSSDFDPVTGRLINWQLETERFIDWAFGLRNTRITFADTYQVAVSTSTSTLTFASAVPMWRNGTAIVVSTTGTLPAPLIQNARYYVVLTGVAGQIKLSLSPTASDALSYIDLTSTGSGILSVSLYDKQRAFPRFELNPQRNNLWIDTPQGVLANVIDGPYADIRIQQTIFDQYNRPIGSDKLTVYREDKRSRVAMRPEIANDVDPIYGNDPYNYIHLGGGHFFIEGYEHFLLLNNYNVSGSLIYDSFLGLSTNNFSVDYFEKKDYTLRPTLGGYYLMDQHFHRNIEGGVTDMQHYYDITTLSELTEVARRSRALVGYKGRTQFLDLLNINSKSQFMFYRGMIQTKGSVASVNAFINSRRFVDANLDEFWAWKLADFGDDRHRLYPEINLFITDGREDLRYEFLGLTESTIGSDAIVAEYTESASKNFNLVSFKDAVRWKDFPEQKQKIGSPLFLDAEASSMIVMYSGETAPPAGRETTIKYWYKPSTGAVTTFNTSSNTWSIPVLGYVVVEGTHVYVHHGIICDTVRVIRRTLTGGNFDLYTTQQLIEDPLGFPTGSFRRIDAETIRMNVSDFVGVFMMFPMNASVSKISPAKLIDTKTSTVVSNIPIWHPAISAHDPYAVRGINFMRPNDPANYNNTLNLSSDNLVFNAWNNNETGNIWWDTAHVGYIPYYDSVVYPNVNDRLAKWGSLAPWASYRVYEWVQSSVPPSKWDSLVAKQANDNTIAHGDKATGTPKKTVFKRTRKQYPVTVVTLASVQRITASSSGIFVQDQVIVFTTSGVLPAGIDPATRYIVSNVSGGITFDLVNFETGDPVVITNLGTGALFAIPTFTARDWVKQPIIHDRISAPFMINLSNGLASFAGSVTYPYTVLPGGTPKLAWIPTDFVAWSTFPEANDPDRVDIYQNGVLIDTGLTVNHSGGTLFVNMSKALIIHDNDTFDIVRPLHALIKSELAYDPDIYDDGLGFVQWKEDFEYTTNTLTSGGKNTGAVTRTNYYFWVEQTTTRNETILGSLSVKQIVDQLTLIEGPYMVVQKPKDDPTLASRYTNVDYIEQSYNTVPVLYRQVILRSIVNYIRDDDRYILRFTSDETLRDTLDGYNRKGNIKDLHEKWVLFRQDQSNTIDYRLWNRLTEALVGYAIDNVGDIVRVPSLDRELYDATYNTNTRIGLGVDQSFVDRDLGLKTILSYLNNPTVDFRPANIDEFFARYSFDTPANIRLAMDTIYNTFGSIHVNAMWFEVLQDSMSLRRKYEELMKTSWLALHGVRVLEVNGLFDE
jgi:hypothetical protein